MEKQRIVCPHCGVEYNLADSEYVALVKQVRDHVFAQEVETQVQAKVAAVQLEADHKIQELKMAQKEALLDAKSKAEKEQSMAEVNMTRLKGELASQKAQHALEEQMLRQNYESQLAAKDEQIAYYKDFKARQSTKMVGESLERHCMDQFNQIRMTAFPHAYFEKDNDARTGSKGDFIYREEQDGVELLSIMFEMKNQMETTVTKHKNEDFFKELDKDRREKGCEYAILVSLLEEDSELYNTGIVDVSYRYDKMYVIRPQFFIPIITILRNSALRAMGARQELKYMQERQLDIVGFEEKLRAFQENIGRNYDLANRQIQDSVDEIDKAIDRLERAKKAILSAQRNVRLMDTKAADLSLERMTRDNPTLRDIFRK